MRQKTLNSGRQRETTGDNRPTTLSYGFWTPGARYSFSKKRYIEPYRIRCLGTKSKPGPKKTDRNIKNAGRKIAKRKASRNLEQQKTSRTSRRTTPEQKTNGASTKTSRSLKKTSRSFKKNKPEPQKNKPGPKKKQGSLACAVRKLCLPPYPFGTVLIRICGASGLGQQPCCPSH